MIDGFVKFMLFFKKSAQFEMFIPLTGRFIIYRISIINAEKQEDTR